MSRSGARSDPRGALPPGTKKGPGHATPGLRRARGPDRGRDGEDSLKDLIISPEDGRVTYALCDRGDVVPIGALKWDATEKRFRVGGDVQGAPMKKGGQHLLATAILDFTVGCTDGACGELENLYFDVASGSFSYAAIDHDGVRVLPWSALSFQVAGEDRQIRLNCTRAALQSAPELDGEVGATIYSPAFRARVDALRGEQKD